MAVLSREDAGTTWPRDRVRAIVIPELRPVLRDTVDIGRRCQARERMAVRADRLRGMVVAHDKEDVGALLPGRLPLWLSRGRERGYGQCP